MARVRLGRGAAAEGNGAKPAHALAKAAWFERARPWRVVAGVAVGCVAVGYAFLLYHHRWDFGRVDLEIYRGGTKIALEGNSPYGDLIRPLGPFLYPPFAVLVMSPLTLMPLRAAQSVWAVLSMASFATTMWLVVGKMRLPREDLRRPLAVALTAVGLCLAPIWLTLVYGQVNIVLMALIAADVLVDRPRWPRGLLVGLAVAIKLTPAVFVAWFLLSGRRREALVAMATFVASVVAGLLLMGDVAADYWTDIALELPKRVDFDHVLNQSAYALLTRFDAPEPRTLATPQIRAMATVGGALCQRTRCWYFRHPGLSCLKKGGDACPARDGNNHFGVAVDLGPCAYPHPSSLALSLLAYDATFSTTTRSEVPIADLYGDGSDPTRDHLLAAGEILHHVTLPPPTPGERTAYVRLMSRRWAEWPLVECVVRLVLSGDDTVARAWVAVGAVANIPLRLPAVEAALVGHRPSPDTLTAAADRAIDGANPLPQTRYKLPMITATVLETLESATR